VKTVVSLLVAALVALGLISVSSPANAAYPKSIATVCNAVSKPLYIKSSATPHLAFSATPAAGNGTPKGTVRITFVKKGVAVRSVTRTYSGGNAVFSFTPLSKGDYSIGARLVTSTSSVFQNCRDGARLFVR
jgi:hypothetical protein